MSDKAYDPAGERSAAEALRASERKYQRLLNNIRDALAAVDLTGRLVEFNAAFEDLVGYSKAELSRMSYRDLTPEKWHALEEAIVREQVLTQGVSDVYEKEYRRKNGTVIPVELRTYLVRDESGQPASMWAIVRDIGERKRAQEALRESEERYRKLFTAMQEGFSLHEIVCDGQGRPCDYRYLDVNPTFERLTGVPRAQWIGRTVKEVLPNIEPSWIQRFGQVALTGIPIEYEDYVAQLDRHFAVIAYSPQPGQFAVISWDITERKRAEAEREELWALFQAAITQSPSGMLIADAADVRIRYVNPAALGIRGKTDRLLTGIDVSHHSVNWQTFRPDGTPYPAEQLPLSRAILQGQVTEQEEVIIRHESGEDRWVSVNAAPVRNREGQITAGIVIFHDITDRKRAEQERAKMERQMQQVQKLESLGVLAGGIAHDFNNLLMSILGNADLALAELPPMSPARDSVREIVNASRRAADLCRQMLAYSGRGQFVLETINLGELIEEMVHLLKASISKKALLNLRLEQGLPALRGDATQIRQVVMNLVINASEAIGDRSGAIAVSTGVTELGLDDLRHAFLNDNLAAGLYVWLEVSDTGCGMDVETQRRIFEPFFTTKFTGRGLGLSAVLGIIRGHLGTIKIYSEPGKGTTFKVLLPALQTSAAVSKPAEPPPTAWKGSGLVLLVDDEDAVRATSRRMLERLGFKVVEARDGREALTIYRDQVAEIVLVILDLTMPHLSGEETHQALRLLNPEARVVMSSGYTETDLASRFANKGLAGVVQKPYSIAELRKCLQNALSPR